MKLLVILTGEMGFDGITNSVLNYYKAMDRSDMIIHVASARRTDEQMKRNFESIGCKVIPLENRDEHPVKYFCNLVKMIFHEKYDIVHAHGNSATLVIETTAAMLAGCKVRVVHSRNSFCEHIKVDKLFRPLLYATYTDGFACGEKAGRWLFGNRNYTIVQNGKNIDQFLFNPDKRVEYRKKLNADDGEVLIGHVGLFHRQKNHPFLIEIFKNVCDVSDRYKLVLIGDGADRQIIEAMVNENGLSNKVVFLGRQTNVSDWLNALDVMVFPSLFEGMPNVVLEWQINGLSAIISDNITRECNVTGTVEFYPLDKGAKKWAEKILKMDIRNRDGEQEKIKEVFSEAGYDIKKNAEKLKILYSHLLKKGA